MTPSKFNQEIEQQLIHHEGLRLKPYRCLAGKMTIAVGRNLEDVGISKSEAELMLRNDIKRVRLELIASLPCYPDLSDSRKLAMIDMCFNLGLPRFLKFKKMIAALKAEDYERAAVEMLDSRWAGQVGQRAKTLAEMVRQG